MSEIMFMTNSGYAEIALACEKYPENAERAINEVLHGEGGPIIYRSINPLIHASGRTFKGHRASATVSHWPEYHTEEPLAIEVAASSAYRYLYFPDDGSNTKRHAGNQRFFLRGGEAVIPRLTEMCLDAVTSAFDG